MTQDALRPLWISFAEYDRSLEPFRSAGSSVPFAAAVAFPFITPVTLLQCLETATLREHIL